LIGFSTVSDRTAVLPNWLIAPATPTGQSLYVLKLLGVSADRPEMQRAISYLVTTQRDDGSWPMTRRGHEGVTPSDFVVPITYFGSAWGTLGLMRSTRK
jgi:hypothetical protein